MKLALCHLRLARALLIGVVVGLRVSATTSAQDQAAASTNRFPVHIRVHADHSIGQWRPFWRFFGADEPNYATMPNGRKLLNDLGALGSATSNSRNRRSHDELRVYFRAHNLLTSGDGTPALKWGSTGAYSEDIQGRARYDWKLLDGIFDAYAQAGLRPYVEIGFMPESLSIKPEPYAHHWQPGARYEEIFTGWAYPPKDYARWSELVFQWARHCVEKYGRAEVEHWYWEVWNEPNIGYWRGSREEFFKLHDYALAGVRRALPKARVGGPDTAGSGGNFMRAFLEHCLRGTNYATGKQGTPLDFVSFHAKGAPTFSGGHVRMGIANELRTVADGFSIISQYPELRNKPVVIGECDPDGCAACQGQQLGYRNGTLYSSYTAASFARIADLADAHQVNLEGALTWAFEFENQPFFAGFRALSSNGLGLPVLNVFRMFSRLGGKRLEIQSDSAVPLSVMLKEGVRAQPDVSALATLDAKRLCVLVWHYHDDDVPGPEADVILEVAGLPPSDRVAQLSHFRIDAEHSNSFTAWQRLGSPPMPDSNQYHQLEQAGALTLLNPAEKLLMANGGATLKFRLPRQAVSLLVMERQP